MKASYDILRNVPNGMGNAWSDDNGDWVSREGALLAIQDGIKEGMLAAAGLVTTVDCQHIITGSVDELIKTIE